MIAPDGRQGLGRIEFSLKGGIVDFEHSDAFQELVRAAGFLFVYAADGKANVYQNVIAYLSVRHEIEEYVALDAAKLHHSQPVLIDRPRLHELTRYRQAHLPPPT